MDTYGLNQEVNLLLYNTSISFALKNEIGQYNIKKFTLFEINNISRVFNNVKITSSKNKEIKLYVKCPLCNNYHCYNYNINELIKREINIGGCESLGMPIFFIGNSIRISEIIDKYKEINKMFCAMI